MSIVSTRIPDGLEKELNEFMREEKLERSVALRKLIYVGIDEWNKKRAVNLLVEGKISFSAAAELANMNVWDFAAFLKSKKVTWIESEQVKEDIEAL